MVKYSSPKRRSSVKPKRSSPKRSSPKRTSVKPKRSSPKRSSVKSGSPKRSIPPLRKGELKKYGYSISLPSDERRIALANAIKEYPVLSVMRKLNALYVLQRNNYPQNAIKFKSDERWLKLHHLYADVNMYKRRTVKRISADGKIRTVRVRGRKLKPAEVARLYSGGSKKARRGSM